MKIRIAGYENDSITDGPGIRFVLFVQGCPRRCPGCHNPESQSYSGGTEVEIEDILTKIRENPLLDGITLSGGEPFLQADKLAVIAKEAHRLGLSVITYTGYIFDDLVHDGRKEWMDLIEESDYIVDGPYEEKLRSLELKFKGSANQRIINVKKTLQMNSEMNPDRI